MSARIPTHLIGTREVGTPRDNKRPKNGEFRAAVRRARPGTDFKSVPPSAPPRVRCCASPCGVSCLKSNRASISTTSDTRTGTRRESSARGRLSRRL